MYGYAGFLSFCFLTLRRAEAFQKEENYNGLCILFPYEI